MEASNASGVPPLRCFLFPPAESIGQPQQFTFKT